MDVLVAGLFTLFICCQNEFKVQRPKLYYFVLYVLPFFAFLSYISFLLMAVVLYNLALESYRQRSFLAHAAGYALLCTGIFIVSYVIDMRFTPREVYSLQGHGGYFIYYDSVETFFSTTIEGINNLFSRWYAESPKVLRKIARFFAVFGLIQMCVIFFKSWKAENFQVRSVNTLGFVLFIEQLLLAIMHKYPLGQPRTSLFFAPFVFYFTVQGISALAKFHKNAYRGVMAIFVIFLLFVSAGLARNVFILGDLGAQSSIWK